MGKKAAAAVITAILIIGILATVFYSYQQIELDLENVEFVKVNFRTPTGGELVSIAGNILLGNVPAAMLEVAMGFIDSADLFLEIRLSNKGFLPVTIPPFTYNLLIYGENVGIGQYPQSVNIPAGSSELIKVKQNVKLTPLAQQILNNNGILEIQIDGKARVLFLDIPFSASKTVDVYDAISNAAEQYVSNLISTQPQVRISPLTVAAAWWTIDGIRVQEAHEGENVVVHVAISAANSFSGAVNMGLRKDIALAPDSSVVAKRFQINLHAGEQEELTASFRAERESGIRGYFVRLSWDSWAYEMPNSYPPRLELLPAQDQCL